MVKTANLTSGLVVKKGQASPAIALVDTTANNSGKAATTDYYKALTVKLDRERYEALKNMGVKLDKKSQEIFVEALDLWIRQTPAQA